MLRTELELMARDKPTGADLQTATASAIEETERLGRLADDLLLLTRADSHRFELRMTAVSPGALARDAQRGRGGVHRPATSGSAFATSTRRRSSWPIRTASGRRSTTCSTTRCATR